MATQRQCCCSLRSAAPQSPLLARIARTARTNAEIVDAAGRKAFAEARRQFLFHAQTFGAWQSVVSVLEEGLDDAAVWRNQDTFENAKPALEYAMQLGDTLHLRS